MVGQYGRGQVEKPPIDMGMDTSVSEATESFDLTAFLEKRTSRQVSGSSFPSIGVPLNVAQSLAEKFGVVDPTGTQRSMIPAMISHRDVCIKDVTGSGKTLGLVVGLLSKKELSRNYQVGSAITTTMDSLLTTTGTTKEEATHDKRRRLRGVFMVPTRELAIQVFQWFRELLQPSVKESDLPLHIQCVVSGVDLVEEQERLLTSSRGPPRFLVGTPKRLLELLGRNIIDIEGLQTIVLDEVDKLVRVKDRHATVKEQVKMMAHPLDGETFVKKVIEKREGMKQNEIKKAMKALKHQRSVERARKIGEGRFEDDHELEDRDLKAEAMAAVLPRLQVVTCSATLNNKMRRELIHKGWIDNPIVLDVSGTQQTPSKLQHHCVVLTSTGTMRNLDMEYWKKRKAAPSQGENGEENVIDDEPYALPDDHDEVVETLARLCHEMDVTRGMVFVSSQISVLRLVERLRNLGISAQELKPQLSILSNQAKDMSEDTTVNDITNAEQTQPSPPSHPADTKASSHATPKHTH
ncbi:hypothetical protein HK102_006604, partial [Quaeritorhiza haematococci]